MTDADKGVNSIRYVLGTIRKFGFESRISFEVQGIMCAWHWQRYALSDCSVV